MTTMTREELLALPLVVDLQTAGRGWGLSRSRVYEAHARGELPFPVVTCAGRLKVTRAALLRSLDIDPDMATAAADTAADALTDEATGGPSAHGTTLRSLHASVSGMAGPTGAGARTG